jgi:hypothetical protein
MSPRRYKDYLNLVQTLDKCFQQWSKTAFPLTRSPLIKWVSWLCRIFEVLLSNEERLLEESWSHGDNNCPARTWNGLWIRRCRILMFVYRVYVQVLLVVANLTAYVTSILTIFKVISYFQFSDEAWQTCKISFKSKHVLFTNYSVIYFLILNHPHLLEWRIFNRYA